jgi:GGDEF domain-containing protein
MPSSRLFQFSEDFMAGARVYPCRRQIMCFTTPSGKCILKLDVHGNHKYRYWKDRMKSRLATAIVLWGWLLFAAWLSYDYAEYPKHWVVHIFRPSVYYEVYGFHILIFLVPFIYTFLGYLVNEREKLLGKIRESEERFKSLSLHDELTNLHNRRGFSFLAEQQLKVAARTKKAMLLVFVDVDNMKWINDKMGHHSGDNALIDAASILRMHIRRADVLARIGGYKLSLSVGFARYDPACPCSLEELLDQADKNMYRHKSNKNDVAS